jgi:predicted RNase H-like HicB family nuclease
MARKFTVVIEKDNEGWLVSEVVGLPGCQAQARTLDPLIERTEETIAAYLEDEEEPIVFSGIFHVTEAEVVEMIIKKEDENEEPQHSGGKEARQGDWEPTDVRKYVNRERYSWKG